MSATICSVVLIIFLSSVLIQINDFAFSMMPGPRKFKQFDYDNPQEKTRFQEIRQIYQDKVRLKEHVRFLKH